jgi:hypothetical protein
MRKSVVFALLLLISAAWLWAQQGNPPSDTGKASGPTTIEGCLQSAAGVYSLTDSSGKVYRLAYSKKLNGHAGQEVQLTGKPGVKTVSDTNYGVASSAELIPIFEVKTVTQVAETCKTPGK